MGDEIYALSGGLAIAKIYLYMVIPIAVSVSVVMIFLRPIYVLTICDMYSDYLSQNNKKANLPNNPKNGKKAVILFIVICAIVALISGFREEIGLTNALSEIPETTREIRYIEKNGIYIEYDPSINGYYSCINSDAGYEISEEMPYDEYMKKLKKYCSDKFSPSINSIPTS